MGAYIWSRSCRLAAFVAIGAASCAHAQQLPGAVQPGAVERSLEDKLPEPAQNRVRLPAPRGFDAPEGAATFRFRLHTLNISGKHGLRDDQFRPLYQSLIGKEITLADLYGVAREITKLYAQKGYALSFAMVPAQEIDQAQGDVRVEVIEGYVHDVHFTSQASPSAKAYAAGITQSQPLRTDDVERALLLMNDLPGTTARSVFKQDDKLPAGATALDVLISQQPVTASAQVDNRGTAAFGPWRASASLGLNNLLHQDESLTLMGLKAINANALNYGSAKASLPVGGDGWTLMAGGTFTDAHPGTPLLTSAGFASSGWTMTASASDPVLRGRDESLWLWAGVEAKWLRSMLATTPNSRDHVYGLQAGATWNRRDASGVTAATITATQGLPLFGATDDATILRSRVDGSGIFAKLEASVTRLQQVGWGFDLYLAGTGQFASRGLLSPEQCGYGGGDIGRGFDSNELAGDHCLQGLAELRRDIMLGSSLITQLEPFIAYDAGAVWTVGPVTSATKSSAAATSFDAGLRTQLMNRLSLSLDYALPVGRDVSLEANRKGRVFLTVGVSL